MAVFLDREKSFFQDLEVEIGFECLVLLQEVEFRLVVVANASHTKQRQRPRWFGGSRSDLFSATQSPYSSSVILQARATL